MRARSVEARVLMEWRIGNEQGNFTCSWKTHSSAKTLTQMLSIQTLSNALMCYLVSEAGRGEKEAAIPCDVKIFWEGRTGYLLKGTRIINLN